MSAKDPKKCCRVLLTWEEEYFKYEKWRTSLAQPPPPNQIQVSEEDKERAKNSAMGIPRPPGGDKRWLRNIIVNVDDYAILENPNDFNGNPHTGNPGRPIIYTSDPKYLKETGSCTRLSQGGGSCNCEDYTGGTAVKGSEQCNNIPREKKNIRKYVKEVRPGYRFSGTISWDEYLPPIEGGGVWTPHKEKLPSSSILPDKAPDRVPVKREDWDLYIQRCTRKVTKEMDCCK